MAKAKTPSFPVTFKVTNKEKRLRVRNGVRIPGTKGDKPGTAEVTVRNRAEYLRLKACKSLELAPAGKGGGDEIDKLTVAELDEQLAAAELSTEGNKGDKVARLREHLDAS